MRRRLLPLAAALLAAGCASSGPQGGDGGVDLAPADDLASAGLGCSGFVQCYNGCGTVDAGACVANCGYNTTPQGQTIYQKALYCGQSWCLGVNDMGSGDCMLDSTRTMLIDPTGSPPGTCTTCLANALAQLYGGACAPPSDPNCNPIDCAAFYMSCANSTP